jgi:outer membrane receptor for ferrienterochelin and colicins
LKTIILTLFLLIFTESFAQNVLKANIVSEESNEHIPFVQVRVQGTALKGLSDDNGYVEINGIPSGRQIIIFNILGYKTDSISIIFPLEEPGKIYLIKLEEGSELNDVVITSTRSGNRMENEPMKVEVIGAEDVEEKYTMKPGNISMLLTESPGIQAQITSAVSGNISFRIQGLDGSYTQVLKDGLPLFGGFSGNLGLMQTPPLDLKQVEIIKGPASTLFGGDAIAGTVNLVSKEPNAGDQWNMILNQTSLQGTDISSFYSKRKDKLGITFLVSGSAQNARDVNGDGITDLSQVREVTINPRIFYYFDDSSKIMLGWSSGYDSRVGGNIANINSDSWSLQTFNEANTTFRNYSQLKYEKTFSQGNVLTVKNSFNIFNRSLTGDHQFFAGTQISGYSEASYLVKFRNNEFVAGLNYLSDDFKEIRPNPDTLTGSVPHRDYTYNTIGVFVQDHLRLTDKFIVEAGLRTDRHNVFGFFFLPSLSLMYKFSPEFTLRAGGGYGYKIPSVFTDYSEKLAYLYVKPIDAETVKAETSKGGNLDFTFKKAIGEEKEFFVTIAQGFFYTEISNPVVPVFVSGLIEYQNAGKSVVSKGFTTNVTVSSGRFNFVAAYTFTDARRLYDLINTLQPFAAKHLVNLDLIYEGHKGWKIGLEGYYIGAQMVEDHSFKPGYWLAGALISKTVKFFTFSLNFENLLDVRQTKYEPILYVPPPPLQASYRDIWAPLDGRVANLSIKITI